MIRFFNAFSLFEITTVLDTHFLSHFKVAQRNPPATINVAETCNQLKAALARVLDERGETRPAQILIDRLVDRCPRIPMEAAAQILRFIFYPFGARTLDHGSQVNLRFSSTVTHDPHHHS